MSKSSNLCGITNYCNLYVLLAFEAHLIGSKVAGIQAPIGGDNYCMLPLGDSVAGVKLAVTVGPKDI